MEVNEKDWKLFRESLPKWQERYMEKLVEEYIEILKKDGSASDKYWALEGRIKADKRNPGVVITDIKRSNFYIHMSSLLRYKVITADDLSDFSEETREAFPCQHHQSFVQLLTYFSSCSEQIHEHTRIF